MAKKQNSWINHLAGWILLLVGLGILGLAFFLFVVTGNPQALLYLGISSLPAFGVSFYIFKTENPFSSSKKSKGNTIGTTISLFRNLGDAPLIQRQISIKQCPSCRKPITWKNARFCSVCGVDLDPQCSQCNIPLKVGDSFCYKCGQSVAKNTPPLISSSTQIESSASLTPTVKSNTSSSVCSSCNATRTFQDTFCGSCGKSFVMGIDKTIQQ